MKHVLAATCWAFAGAIALGAQTPYPQDQPKAKAPMSGDEKTVTVTGCLRAGDEPGTFVLANVKTDPSTGQTTGQTQTPTGTTGTAAIAPDSTLRLMAAPANVNLKAHVGHTVRLTGTIAPAGSKDPATSDPKAGTAGAPPPTTTPAEPATPPAGTAGQRAGETARGAAAMQSFNVKTMNHVSEKCPM
jgi:hypothetical protein